MSLQVPQQPETCESCVGGCACGYDSSTGGWCSCERWCKCPTCRPAEPVQFEPQPGPDGRPVPRPTTGGKRRGLRAEPNVPAVQQECVYQDYGLAKEVGWEPGDYLGVRSLAVEPAAAQAGKAAGGGPSGVPTTRHPEGSGDASGASKNGA